VEQTLGDEHENWHCLNMDNCSTPALGAEFFRFHRQICFDYDSLRTRVMGLPRLQTWDSRAGAPLPGDDETLNTSFTECSEGGVRPAARPCTNCCTTPPALLGTNLGAFPSMGDMAVSMRCDVCNINSGLSWHDAFHIGAGNASGTSCDDIGNFTDFSVNVRDPVFWLFHNKFNAFARDWQRQQALDVVIVLDRSAHMDDNCPGGTADQGETPCRLNDAKEAIKMFADMLQNVRPGAGAPQHRLGLVSYNGTATVNLGLTPVAGIVTNNGMDDTPLELALAGITAGGATSIGAGIQAALGVVNAGANPSKAIIVVADGPEDTAPLIKDIEGAVHLDVRVCAFGYGETFADPEDRLRNLAEEHGGMFLADADLSSSVVNMEKVLANCAGLLTDEPLDTGPVSTLPAGQVCTTMQLTQLCTADSRLTTALGHDWNDAACDLRLVVETPTGALVRPGDAGVETGGGASWGFSRTNVPYRGDQVGGWNAYAVRPQRVFTNGFTTDAAQTLAFGTGLVRGEIHRLFPDGVINTCLYYEDGSASGTSAYRNALQAEVAAGVIGALTTASSAANFNTLLAQNWDLIVFARQINLTAQVYDAALQAKICGGTQKAILTDFYNPGTNAILNCAGTVLGNPRNYTQLNADGRLIPFAIPLVNRGYTNFAYTTTTSGTGGPWLIQGFNNQTTGAIVGTGTNCGAQVYAISQLVRGLGTVEPAQLYPHVLIGQNIVATFRMTEAFRPANGWTTVTANLTLDRPGGGALEQYTLSDNGTNGDQLSGNNYWERSIPLPATVPGPHSLHASFNLTTGGCTIHREADYNVIVTADPARCTGIYSPSPRLAAQGDTVPLVGCVQNNCLATDSVRVTVTDTRGWLCEQDAMGNYHTVAMAQFTTPPIAAERATCFEDIHPLAACLPATLPMGDSTIVTFRAHSFAHPSAADSLWNVVVRVAEGTTGVPEPLPTQLRVRVVPVRSANGVNFHLQLPISAAAQFRIYDMRGRQVALLWDGPAQAGTRELTWVGTGVNEKSVPSGVYTYRFTLGAYQASGTVLLLR
jgi:hypothetical protein